MTASTDKIITAEDLGNGGILPTTYANEIIQGPTEGSVILSRARHIPMPSRTRTMPVLDAMPLMYWVNGDTGLKQTTEQKWGNLTITAEEAAAIVPIPEAIIADSSIDLWGEIKPRLIAARDQLIDSACLFGVNKPASFPEGIVKQAKTAKNTVAEGTGADLGADVALLCEKLATQGFNVDGFACQPGLNWKLMAARDAEGRPVFVPNMQAAGTGTLYGYAMQEVKNGTWNPSEAVILAADWSNFLVGIRQDISYKLLDQAVISDEAGKVVLNLAQQDCVALRVTFRLGFQVANPITQLQNDKTKRFPAGVITPKAN